MPNEHIPGTTPVGTGPQGTTGTDNNNQPGANGAPGRKIAGKFDTIEQAVEQGYTGLERAFHEQSEKIGNLTALVERLVVGDGSQPGGYSGYVPVGQGGQGGYNPGGYGQRFNPYQQQDPDYVDPTQFVVNPGRYLAERDERIIGKVAGMVSNIVSNAMVVNDFKLKNPDLARHEKMVQTFLREEDQRLPLATRMANAGNKARAYLAEINPAAGQPASPPNSDQYVPGPGGAASGYAPLGSPLQPGAAINTQQQAEEERELYEYIAERNKLAADHFGDTSRMHQVQGQDTGRGQGNR